MSATKAIGTNTLMVLRAKADGSFLYLEHEYDEFDFWY